MTRLESVWPEPRIGRDSEKARIAGHMRDHLTPLFEVLQWIFALQSIFVAAADRMHGMWRRSRPAKSSEDSPSCGTGQPTS